MKEFFDVTILAVLQGVAEFLPISSSGHLVIGQHLLGVDAPGMRLDLFLHVGTLAAIFAYYARRIAELARGMCRGERDAWIYAAKIACSALPAVAVYFLFRREIEGLFENARMVGALLMFTGATLLGTRYFPRGRRAVSFSRAMLMGMGQALALLPGVSRSGTTLASARLGRVDPEAAAEFSFLMSAPLILGGALLQLGESLGPNAVEAGPSWGLTVWGAAVAAVVGYASLAALVRLLKGRAFWAFGVYCLVAGLATLCFC